MMRLDKSFGGRVLSFQEYIANGRYFGDFVFDLIIADEVAKAWYDSFENQWFPERGWCLEHIRPGQTVVDAGAHHGLMSILFGRQVGPSGRVIAYDILPRNAEIVRRNLALNGVSNVEVRALGLGKESADVGGTDYGGNFVVAGRGGLKVVALDDELRNERVDFIKLDVEGSDLEAMIGARHVLKRDRPVLDLELHNSIFADRRSTLRQISEILAPLQYRYEVLPEIAGEIVPLDRFDIDYLSRFDNVHVFCTHEGAT